MNTFKLNHGLNFELVKAMRAMPVDIAERLTHIKPLELMWRNKPKGVSKG